MEELGLASGQAAETLAKVKGVELVTQTFFNEFTIKTSKASGAVIDALRPLTGASG